jgi:hypothetical protein
MKSLISSFLVLFFLSCNQNADKTASSIKISPLPAIEESEAVADTAAAVAEYAVSNYDVDETASKAKDEYKGIAPKIIKNGNLRFETGDIEATYAQIKTAVGKHQGIVQNDTEGKDYQSVFKNITVRIPNEKFDAFVADISKGVSYFDNKEISSADVTEEYIDTEARLKAKKVLEARYFELLKKAAKVSEMIEIEKQLSEIREEIEAKEGQLRYMQNRIAMSTVTIQFYKTIASESGVTVSYGSKIWNAIKSGFNGISSFFIGLLEVWPFIVILVAVIYFIRKRFKKKRNKNEHLS